MVALRFSVTIGEDRRLVIDLPPEMPLGPAELTLEAESASQPINPDIDRETLMAQLRAAGLLVEPDEIEAVDDADILTDEELATFAVLPPGARPSHEWIAEDRGEW